MTCNSAGVELNVPRTGQLARSVKKPASQLAGEVILSHVSWIPRPTCVSGGYFAEAPKRALVPVPPPMPPASGGHMEQISSQCWSLNPEPVGSSEADE